MNCKNCDTEVKENSNFCSSCGKAKPVNENQIVFKEDNPSKVKSISEQISYFLVLVISFIVGKYLGFIAFFVFFFAWLIGSSLSKWYLKREHINITLVKWIVYSNFLAFFIPPIGVMTGFATLEISKHFPSARKRYKTIAVLGITISILNALAGVITNI